MNNRDDHQIMRELAIQYAEIAANPVQEERRQLWTNHNSLKPTRVPILAIFGMWNVWCRKVFGEDTLQCKHPFYRMHEQILLMKLFEWEVSDDSIQEPWLTIDASRAGGWRSLWGVEEGQVASYMEGGAWKFDPPIKNWDDAKKMAVVNHCIDETVTHEYAEMLHDAVGDILPIDIRRGCAYSDFMADISTSLAGLRGLEQVMVDMCESPNELKKLIGYMRDGILQVQQEAEVAGDYRLTNHSSQQPCYCKELERPAPNSGIRKRKDLWGFFAAQEFTLISPKMHDEFLIQYQLPIMKNFGLLHYGCCENLTRKIDILRQIPNLRSIAVSPTANVARCAEQIGTDYVLSYRPNPADMVCCGFDEEKVRQILSADLKAAKGSRVHIHLKDVETLEGDTDRLRRWVQIARDTADNI